MDLLLIGIETASDYVGGPATDNSAARRVLGRCRAGRRDCSASDADARQDDRPEIDPGFVFDEGGAFVDSGSIRAPDKHAGKIDFILRADNGRVGGEQKKASRVSVGILVAPFTSPRRVCPLLVSPAEPLVQTSLDGAPTLSSLVPGRLDQIINSSSRYFGIGQY